MSITRTLHDFSAGSGATAKSDTGPPLNGVLYQARWESMGSADTGATDTGADLQIYIQQREADTGNGYLVVNDDDILGADFQRMFRSPVYGADGVVDTGHEAPVLANERLRVRIVPGSAGVKGRLYIWTIS